MCESGLKLTQILSSALVELEIFPGGLAEIHSPSRTYLACSCIVVNRNVPAVDVGVNLKVGRGSENATIKCHYCQV